MGCRTRLSLVATMLLLWTACISVAQNPEIKRLGKLELFVYVAGGGRSLQVHFFQGPDAPHLTYAEVTVRAFDEDRHEIEVTQSLPGEKNYMGPPYRGSQHAGFYGLSPNKDKRVATVEVSRGGEKQTFQITPKMIAPPIILPPQQER